jgi:hypothetical protein
VSETFCAGEVDNIDLHGATLLSLRYSWNEFAYDAADTRSPFPLYKAEAVEPDGRAGSGWTSGGRAGNACCCAGGRAGSCGLEAAKGREPSAMMMARVFERVRRRVSSVSVTVFKRFAGVTLLSGRKVSAMGDFLSGQARPEQVGQLKL